MKIRYVIRLITAMILTVGCQSEEHIDRNESSGDSYILSVPLNIGIPDSEPFITRAMGDPGTYERFRAPRWAYVYMIVEYSDGSTLACPTLEVPEPPTAPFELTDPISLSSLTWTKEKHGYSTPQTQNDSIFVCSRSFHFQIKYKNGSASATKGRLYVAASYEKLPNLMPVIVKSDDGLIAQSTESGVQNMTFDVKYDEEDISNSLQDVYSTPYNYEIDNKYYATLNDVSASSTESMTVMLYHVASKVDLMWNVPTANQSDLRITHIEARKLKQKNCYLFKPMENSWTTSGEGNDEANNYSLRIMNNDVGQQWYGRSYFYTIPYKNEGKFDIHLHMLKNGDDPETNENSGYNLRVRKTVTASMYNVFVPWFRPDLVFGTGNMPYSASYVVQEVP